LIQAVMLAMAQAKEKQQDEPTPNNRAKAKADSKADTKPTPKPKPQPKVRVSDGDKPDAAMQRPSSIKKEPSARTEPAQAKGRDEHSGVSVDLANLGAGATATPVQRNRAAAVEISATLAPEPPAPAAKPAQASAVDGFAVVGVLDGMVLVQQGRRVTPVTVGQALPDGRLLRSTDPASHKFDASRP
jgi:hypothetical protein